MRIRFLVNPAAGAGRALRSVDRWKAAAAFIFAPIEFSQGTDDLAARARRAVKEGVERIVAVGGDGTFHHVLRGLAGSDCELALLPMGTGNDLAAVAGVPRHWRRALQMAIEAPARPFDLGEVATALGKRIPFGVYCGSGLDSEVSRWARERRGREGGRFVYLLGALAVLRSFRAPHLTVEHDAGRFEGPAMLAVAANGDRFGGGMRVAPQADPRDGKLDLVLAREVSRGALLGLLLKVYFGWHVGHPAIELVRTRRLRIASDRPLPLALDGEDGGELGPRGVEISVRPGALRLVGS